MAGKGKGSGSEQRSDLVTEKEDAEHACTNNLKEETIGSRS